MGTAGAAWAWMRLGQLSGPLVLLVLSLLPARASAFDEPAVRTARLAYFQGEVTVLRADNTGGDPAQLNMPLTEGVRVSTGGDGQAEIEFEDGSLVRVTPQSSVLLFRLATGTDGSFDTQAALLNGLVYAELRAIPKYAYQIEAGDETVTPVANATVRITLDQPPAEVAVLDGTAHVEQAGGGYRVDVAKGEALRGDAAGGGRYFLTQRIEHNSWDDWNEEREQAAADQLAARTTARDGYAGDQGYGWSDLDTNGTWFDAGQGPVWQPFDASVSGFDPYGYGSWVYTTGPGYVWSSGYSWGWTPFRCGSWNYWQGFGWGWMPMGGCGYGGFGYAGGGGYGPGGGRRVNRTNLSNVPPGYQRPLPPTVGGAVRVHPIVPVRTGPPPTRDRVRAFEARQIGGTTVMPLRTLGSGYTSRGGSAVGASLRRDFPVDRVTRQPVMGSLTVPVGRRAPETLVRPGEAAPGVAAGAGSRVGRPGADGYSAARRQAAGEGVSRPDFPSRNGVAVPGSLTPVTSPGTTASAGAAGSASPAPRPVFGSSVASPPPQQGVRVHPGDREGDGGNRVERFNPNPVNRMPPPPVGVRPAPTVSAPPQAVRPMPVAPAPAPVRSAPPSSPPAPVRSAPPPAPSPAAAPASSAASKK